MRVFEATIMAISLQVSIFFDDIPNYVNKCYFMTVILNALKGFVLFLAVNSMHI